MKQNIKKKLNEIDGYIIAVSKFGYRNLFVFYLPVEYVRSLPNIKVVSLRQLQTCLVANLEELLETIVSDSSEWDITWSAAQNQ
jgi:hypothetical protein